MCDRLYWRFVRYADAVHRILRGAFVPRETDEKITLPRAVCSVRYAVRERPKLRLVRYDACVVEK